MKEPHEFEECARRLKALADPERLRIITCLGKGPRNVSDLAKELGEEVVKISHHLGVLRNAGVVEVEKEGRYAIYRIHPDVAPPLAGTELLGIDFGCCRIDFAEDE